MSTNVSIGFSQHPDPQNAVLEACVQVKNQLNTPETDLIIVFASPGYIIAETQTVIGRTLKPKHLVGSSTSGILLPQGIANRGIAVVCINSDDMRFGASAVKVTDGQDMREAGFELARKAAQDLDVARREVFILLAQGMEQNISPFIRGIKESLGGGFAVLGAVSSDDFQYKQCSQFFQDQILQNCAVGLLVGGSAHLALGYKHGFKPLGKPRAITKVDGHLIRTIDGKPAVDIYQHFLGPEAQGLKNTSLNSYAAMYPLGFYQENSGQYLLRNPIDILPDGSIVCHEGIAQGAEVHLMISNQNACNHSCLEAAKAVKASLGDKEPHLILVFESWVRQKILGRGAFGIIQNIKDILGSSVPIAGMYSYGEIGPFDTLNNIKNIYLHNAGILIVAIA